MSVSYISSKVQRSNCWVTAENRANFYSRKDVVPQQELVAWMTLPSDQICLLTLCEFIAARSSWSGLTRYGSESLQLEIVVLFCLGFDSSVEFVKPPVSRVDTVKSSYVLHRQNMFLNALK